MQGLLITNKYMLSEKFIVLKNGFIEEAKNIGLKLDYKNNSDAYNLIDKKVEYDFILFYDKDMKLAKSLEKSGYRLFNRSRAIEICDDKYLTYTELEKSINQPLTISSPYIFYGDLSNDEQFIEKCEKTFSYPMVVKECCGSFGFQVYKVDKKEQLIDCLIKIGTKPFIVQKYIGTSFGRDLRLQVIGNEVVCAIQRINKNGDFRANLTNGAVAYNYEANAEQVEMALSATKKIKLDFAGVDLLFGENDKPILCEVNSNAHIENISNVCKVNVYKKMLEYIIKEVK